MEGGLATLAQARATSSFVYRSRRAVRPEQPVPSRPRSIPARGASHSTQPPPAPTHTFPVASKRRTAPLRTGYIPLARSNKRDWLLWPRREPRPVCLPLLMRRVARAACPKTTAFHSCARRLALDATATGADPHLSGFQQAAHRAAPSGLYSTRAHRRKGDSSTLA